MIDCLIFTKDRACQLDLLLRSIKSNFEELEHITILYNASNSRFMDGYSILKNRYPDFKWIKETDLVPNIKEIVSTFSHDFCMTLVDDEIIINNHSISTMLEMLSTNETLHCASLRLGRNVTYTYTSNVYTGIPSNMVKKDGHDIYGWKWKSCNPISDWGYPSCINSHIYRTSLFKSLVLNNNFKNVNDLEGLFDRHRHIYKDVMICFDTPKTLNIANNLVQSGFNRHSDKEEYTTEALNDKLLSGYIIDPTPIYEHSPNSATLEFDYTFIIENTEI